MPRYKFEKIAVNSTAKKKPTREDKDTYLGLEHIDSGCLHISRFGTEVAPIGEKLLMKKGDVLFGKRRAYQKKVAIAPFDGIFSAHGMVLRPREDVITQEFFPLFISSDYFLDAAISISVGSLSPTINWGALKELEFDLPDLATQGKLARLLWAAIETKNAYRHLIFLTDSIVKSQFIEMFGDPGTNPMGWERGTIRDIAADVRYGTSKPASENGKYAYLRMNNITYGGELDLSDLKSIDVPDNEVEKYIVRNGDVLFNRTNSKELVGKTCVFNSDTPMIIAGYIIRVRVNHRATPTYLSAFLNSDYGKLTLRSMCKSIIGQANINAQELQDIKISIPPLELQNQFARFVEQADKSKFALQNTLEKLEATYKGLLNKHLG